jgi:hypothetical protein
MSETIIDVLASVLGEWRSLTKSRQRHLLRLCKLKYDELHRAHSVFMKFFEDVENVLLAAERAGPGLNADLERQIVDLDRERRAGRQERLSSFEEARIYSVEKYPKLEVSFSVIPEQVTNSVHSVMDSYVSYFGNEQSYEHEAARLSKAILALLRERKVKAEPFDPHHASTILLAVSQARTALELKWMRFSRDYYRTYATFADHGIYSTDD